jgi:macrolide-specific efflux system membrane fusion protein
MVQGQESSHLPRKANDGIVLESSLLKTIESTTLAAQLSGTLRELTVTEGDVVEVGQIIGRIDDDAVRLKLEHLRTEINIAKKKQANDINHRLAEKGKLVAINEFERAVKANALVPDTYPLNEIDRLRLMADKAALEVERAIYDQEIAELEVQLASSDYRQAYELYLRHQIKAPVEGVVTAVEKRVGEWLDPGTTLVRIVRIDRLRVEGFISATEALGNLVGRSALVQLIGAPESTFAQARVAFVSPDVNPVNSQVRVFLEIDNAEGVLRPGLRVTATIDTEP